MKHINTVFLCLLAAFSVPTFAQHTINGTVTDPAGQFLVGANVFLEGTNYGSVSNASGQYSIHNVPAGDYSLKVSSIGYDPIIRKILVPANAQLNVVLKENLTHLPAVVVERETMTGGTQFVNTVPGSAHFISAKQLAVYNYGDVNRILRNIPGVNIQEEEGFGLRPNIGLRGSGVERSSKITLMEDGILAAPAPYVAPSAYYFPTVGRMQGVEVRKGSSQIKYGPFTTGGAINFLSTPIPTGLAATINLLGGNFGRKIIQANVGHGFEYGGFMLETYQQSADGFKELDNGNATGFTNTDYIFKGRINTAKDAKIYQALTLKVGDTRGDADETYLGLTEEDFAMTPNRRYYGSQMDHIGTEQHQLSLKYNIIPTKFMDVGITAYKNEFSRNWYKLDKVKYDVDTKKSISAILDDPITYANEYQLLTGSSSPNADALFVKNNNRDYYAKGIQGTVGLTFNSAEISQDIEIGFRMHQDQEDRYQWEDAYQMETGVMKLSSAGTPGTDANRVTTADAFASYMQYSFVYGKFKALPGIRFESINIERLDFGKSDTERSGSNLITTTNAVDVWIPGIGLEYTFTNSIQSFVGIHKGFAPPGATEGTLPESSINYEVGTRIKRSALSGQAIAFYNDYSNLLGTDLAASGGGGTGDQFNAGAATIYGAEIEFGYVITSNILSGIQIPITLAYTYTHGEFGTSFTAENADWGTVTSGDEIPYIAANQLTINAGLEHKYFNVNISTKYVGDMRTTPGSGEMLDHETIYSNFIMDMSANVRATRNIYVFSSVSNVTNEVYLVARRPAGLRPGLPRSFLMGIKFML